MEHVFGVLSKFQLEISADLKPVVTLLLHLKIIVNLSKVVYLMEQNVFRGNLIVLNTHLQHHVLKVQLMQKHAIGIVLLTHAVD